MGGRGSKFKTKLLWEKYKGICVHCKQKVPLKKSSKDHIIPRSRGGSGSIENLALACKSCNSKRGDKLIDPITFQEIPVDGSLPYVYRYKNFEIKWFKTENKVMIEKEPFKLIPEDPWLSRMAKLENNEMIAVGGLTSNFQPSFTDRILYLLNLKKDWDGNGADVIPKDLVDSAIQLANKLERDGRTIPHDIYQLAEGTIVFEWQWPTTKIVERYMIEEVGSGTIMISFPDNKNAEFLELKW